MYVHIYIHMYICKCVYIYIYVFLRCPSSANSCSNATFGRNSWLKDPLTSTTTSASKPEVEGDDFVKRHVGFRASGLSSNHDTHDDDDDDDDHGDDKRRTLEDLLGILQQP